MMLWLLACTRHADFDIEPSSLNFGEVTFEGEVPEEGYASQDVSYTNAGKATIALTLPPWDEDRLCLPGLDGFDTPYDLGDVDPGSTLRITVGICYYLPGEIDSEVSTQLDLETDGDPDTLTVPITFTPVRP
jgi:hypothetical protein